MGSKQLCVGIIGAGRIGKVHIDTICNRVNNAWVKTVVDLQMNENLEQLLAHYGIRNFSESHEDVIFDPEIDAVIVASSTDTHAAFIKAGVEAGKHVFCEKPIDIDVRRIREVLETVEQSGCKLQIGFHRRFDRHHRNIYEGVRAGKVGTASVIKITSRDPTPPSIEYIRNSGGIFIDSMIHDFDLARYLMGCEIAEVYAKGACHVDQAIEEAGDVDTAAVIIKFQNGTIGVIDISRRAVYGHDQRIEVFGSEGCLLGHNEQPFNTEWLTHNGIHKAKPHYFFLERYYEAFVEEIKAFITAINDDAEVLCTGVDGLNSVLVAKAAAESNRRGVPVTVEYH